MSSAVTLPPQRGLFVRGVKKTPKAWGIFNNSLKLKKSFTIIFEKGGVFLIAGDQIQRRDQDLRNYTLPNPSGVYILAKLAPYVENIKSHPLTNFIKGYFLFQKAIDFGITSSKWIHGKASNTELMHRLSLVSLAYIPIFFEQMNEESEASTLLLFHTIILVMALNALKNDLLSLTDSTYNFPSETHKMVKEFFNYILHQITYFLSLVN